MISPETEELVRQAWLAGIPPQYRLTGKDKGLCQDRFLSAAIIQPPPKLAIVERFLRSIFGEQHLTFKQRQAKEARMRIGRPGRKRTRLSRARPKPHLMSFSELAAETKPYLDLDLTHG
jgi:hypothetical protein